jgi:hypothetical protein
MSAVERLLIWSFGVHLAVRVGAPPLRGKRVSSHNRSTNELGMFQQ